MTVVTPAAASVPPKLRTAVGLAAQALGLPYLDWANGQVVSFSDTAAASSAYAGAGQGLNTPTDTIYLISATENCWISVGNTAAKDTAGSFYLPTGVVITLYVPGGSTVSVVEDSTGGYLSLIPALLF